MTHFYTDPYNKHNIRIQLDHIENKVKPIIHVGHTCILVTSVY